MKLTLITETDYESFVSRAINEYAQDKIDAGSWDAKSANQKAQAEFKQLLPEGLKSRGNYIYSILDDDTKVGIIWIAKLASNPGMAFIYDFRIFDAFQNKGLGTEALTLAAKQAKALGFKTLGLHVFGSNARAIHVYEKSAFQITDINMQKTL
ncbi:GNAT family N-acetyltransferase [Oenococcus sicerae]|uniref:GNAT family N-acetyltransferase n=1 Tax=Oenococcus sicerae TaxID=2203724 RepID=UPI0010B2C75B|nr:putative N-acetyltransferase YycN [Oenococcus sicerae]